MSAEVCAKDNPAFPHNHALIALHCFAQILPDSIVLHCSITPKLHCTEIVARLLQLGIAQIELQSIGVGKFRHGGRHGNSRSDWFVEHRIATWGHRTMVPISGARHQSSGDQMGTNWVSRGRGDPCWWNFWHLHSPALCNTVSHGWTDESECFPIESDEHGSSG